MTLHQDSLARYVAESLGKMGPTQVDPEVWIAQNWYGRQIEVTEESWTLDGYNSVLTLSWSPTWTNQRRRIWWDITKGSLVDHEVPRILLGTGRLAAKGGEVVLLGCFEKNVSVRTGASLWRLSIPRRPDLFLAG